MATVNATMQNIAAIAYYSGTGTSATIQCDLVSPVVAYNVSVSCPGNFTIDLTCPGTRGIFSYSCPYSSKVPY